MDRFDRCECRCRECREVRELLSWRGALMLWSLVIASYAWVVLGVWWANKFFAR